MAKVTHHAMFHPNPELVSPEAHQVHELEYPTDCSHWPLSCQTPSTLPSASAPAAPTPRITRMRQQKLTARKRILARPCPGLIRAIPQLDAHIIDLVLVDLIRQCRARTAVLPSTIMRFAGRAD